MLCFDQWDTFEVKCAENIMDISGCEGRSNLKMWVFHSIPFEVSSSQLKENCEYFPFPASSQFVNFFQPNQVKDATDEDFENIFQ